MHAIRKWAEAQMTDRLRLGAVWTLTFVLCGVLIATA